MNTLLRKPAVSLLLVLSVACVKSNPEAPRQKSGLSFITREQLIEHHFATAWDAVQSLRGNWLQTRGTDSFRTPSRVWVYFDDVRLGDVETLRSVATMSVSYIEHFDGIEATSRWGVGHSAGVIYVSTHPAVPVGAQL